MSAAGAPQPMASLDGRELLLTQRLAEYLERQDVVLTKEQKNIRSELKELERRVELNEVYQNVDRHVSKSIPVRAQSEGQETGHPKIQRAAAELAKMAIAARISTGQIQWRFGPAVSTAFLVGCSLADMGASLSNTRTTITSDELLSDILHGETSELFDRITHHQRRFISSIVLASEELRSPSTLVNDVRPLSERMADADYADRIQRMSKIAAVNTFPEVVPHDGYRIKATEALGRLFLGGEIIPPADSPEYRWPSSLRGIEGPHLRQAFQLNPDDFPLSDSSEVDFMMYKMSCLSAPNAADSGAIVYFPSYYPGGRGNADSRMTFERIFAVREGEAEDGGYLELFVSMNNCRTLFNATRDRFRGESTQQTLIRVIRVIMQYRINRYMRALETTPNLPPCVLAVCPMLEPLTHWSMDVMAVKMEGRGDARLLKGFSYAHEPYSKCIFGTGSRMMDIPETIICNTNGDTRRTLADWRQLPHEQHQGVFHLTPLMFDTFKGFWDNLPERIGDVKLSSRFVISMPTGNTQYGSQTCGYLVIDQIMRMTFTGVICNSLPMAGNRYFHRLRVMTILLGAGKLGIQLNDSVFMNNQSKTAYIGSRHYALARINQYAGTQIVVPDGLSIANDFKRESAKALDAFNKLVLQIMRANPGRDWNDDVPAARENSRWLRGLPSVDAVARNPLPPPPPPPLPPGGGTGPNPSRPPKTAPDARRSGSTRGSASAGEPARRTSATAGTTAATLSGGAIPSLTTPSDVMTAAAAAGAATAAIAPLTTPSGTATAADAAVRSIRKPDVATRDLSGAQLDSGVPHKNYPIFETRGAGLYMLKMNVEDLSKSTDGTTTAVVNSAKFNVGYTKGVSRGIWNRILDENGEGGLDAFEAKIEAAKKALPKFAGMRSRNIPRMNVTERIARTDGSELRREYSNVIQLDNGDVIVTESGLREGPEFIIHAVVPFFREGREPTESALQNLEKNYLGIMDACLANNISRVVIPLLGSGAHFLDTFDAAKAAAGTIHAVMTSRPEMKFDVFITAPTDSVAVYNSLKTAIDMTLSRLRDDTVQTLAIMDAKADDSKAAPSAPPRPRAAPSAPLLPSAAPSAAPSAPLLPSASPLPSAAPSASPRPSAAPSASPRPSAALSVSQLPPDRRYPHNTPLLTGPDAGVFAQVFSCENSVVDDPGPDTATVNAANQAMVFAGMSGITGAFAAKAHRRGKLKDLDAHIVKLKRDAGLKNHEDFPKSTVLYSEIGEYLHGRGVKHMVLNVAGPDVSRAGGDSHKQMTGQPALARCYRNLLSECKKRNIRRIVLPAISTGVYGFPLNLAARTAVLEIYRWMTDPANAVFANTMEIFISFWGNPGYARTYEDWAKEVIRTQGDVTRMKRCESFLPETEIPNYFAAAAPLPSDLLSAGALPSSSTSSSSSGSGAALLRAPAATVRPNPAAFHLTTPPARDADEDMDFEAEVYEEPPSSSSSSSSASSASGAALRRVEEVKTPDNPVTRALDFASTGGDGSSAAAPADLTPGSRIDAIRRMLPRIDKEIEDELCHALTSKMLRATAAEKKEAVEKFKSTTLQRGIIANVNGSEHLVSVVRLLSSCEIDRVWSATVAGSDDPFMLREIRSAAQMGDGNLRSTLEPFGSGRYKAAMMVLRAACKEHVSSVVDVPRSDPDPLPHYFLTTGTDISLDRLSRCCAAGGFSDDTIFRIALEGLKGLKAIHAQRIVLGDISPQTTALRFRADGTFTVVFEELRYTASFDNVTTANVAGDPVTRKQVGHLTTMSICRIDENAPTIIDDLESFLFTLAWCSRHSESMPDEMSGDIDAYRRFIRAYDLLDVNAQGDNNDVLNALAASRIFPVGAEWSGVWRSALNQIRSPITRLVRRPPAKKGKSGGRPRFVWSINQQGMDAMRNGNLGYFYDELVQLFEQQVGRNPPPCDWLDPSKMRR